VIDQMLRPEVMRWALSSVPLRPVVSAARYRGEHRDRYHRLRSQLFPEQWGVAWLALSVLLATAAMVFGARGLGVAFLLVVAFIGVSRARCWKAGRYLLACLRMGWLYFRWGLARFRLGVESARWGAKAEQAIEPAVWRTTRDLLGDDPDSLLVAERSEGLRSPRGGAYRVDNAAMQTLNRKLSQIESGTIAVCGPRGAGKSTLLEASVAKADFGLLAQAPASYTPHDFLLSLSVDLCEAYIRHHGHDVPPLVQMSPVKRLLRKGRTRAARLLKWAAFALPAAVAVILGVGAGIRASAAEHLPPLVDISQRYIEERRADTVGIWQGQAAAGTSLTLAVLGVAWWRARHSEWIRDTARGAWQTVASIAGVALIATAALGVAKDAWIKSHLPDAAPIVFVVALGSGALWLLLSATSAAVPMLWIRGVLVRPRIWLGVLAGLTGWAGLWYALRSTEVQAVLAAPGNALHLAELIAGIGLLSIRHWAPRPAEPDLVARCRTQLLRLQAQLSSSATLTSGTPQILTLGTSHTTSVTVIPPNYPEVVQDFKELLAKIAADFADRDETVVIAIDELDRLGTDSQALAFLAEIKAIFGVEHVHYVLAVAEDVGAAFIRRGLPHRDVTDSSLDDVVYVQPATLTESRAMLDKRAELTGPYAVLTHSMAGGIPRDLVRYGRRIMDMKDRTGSGEMVRIARHLILDELSETLAGFRTLLAKQQWTQGTGSVLSSFRTLVGLLRESCPCTEDELRRSLQEFAFYATEEITAGPAERELADEARLLIDEASAYTYFSLTLLDIFASEALERRTRQAARNGPDGHLERLAQARQELAISPYSTRPLIDVIRKAWSLPTSPTGNLVHWPWERDCSIHTP
jgi:hypothetical protein